MTTASRWRKFFLNRRLRKLMMSGSIVMFVLSLAQVALALYQHYLFFAFLNILIAVGSVSAYLSWKHLPRR